MIFKLLKFKLNSFNMNIFFCESELYKNRINNLCKVLFHIILINFSKSSYCTFSKNFFLFIAYLFLAVYNFGISYAQFIKAFFIIKN